MKRIVLLPLLAALGLSIGACQKQPTEAERKTEIERQVQQRLDSEHQADEEQRLTERQAELDARERALAAQENRPIATAAPVAARPVATATPVTRTTTTRASETGSYSTFYRKLEPYGDWMETGDYGYVFQPRQAAQSRDWRPYTNGHWVYTDAGWTWISDEQFGWATYHYGRWTRLRGVGWVWVPGEQWAPAWVSWRKGNDFVGWAPLPPEAQFDRQTGIRNWADNYYDIGPDQYAFVPANQFGAKVSARVVVPTERNVTIINQTTNVTNITYNNSVIVDRGPSYDDLRAGSSQPIERFRLERTQDFNNERPVFRGEVVALPTLDYRPAERAARPERVTRTIAQPVVERGWNGIQDNQAAEKARTKMKAEATPPANLPPKRFVRPNPPGNPGNSAPVSVGKPLPRTTPVPVATPAVTATPMSPATPAPVAEPIQPSPAENIYSPKEAARNRREAEKAAREAKQKQRLEEQAQRRAERPQNRPDKRGRQPNETPAAPPPIAATPAPSATPETSRRPRPVETSTPVPTLTPAPAITPSTTPAPATAPDASATPAQPGARSRGDERRAQQEERRAQKAQQMAERRAKKSGETPAPSPAEEAAAEASPTDSPAEKGNHRPRRGQRGKNRRANAEASPSPSATP